MSKSSQVEPVLEAQRTRHGTIQEVLESTTRNSTSTVRLTCLLPDNISLISLHGSYFLLVLYSYKIITYQSIKSRMNCHWNTLKYTHLNALIKHGSSTNRNLISLINTDYPFSYDIHTNARVM